MKHWTSSSKSSMWTFSTLVIMNAYRKRARDSLPDYTVTSTPNSVLKNSFENYGLWYWLFVLHFVTLLNCLGLCLHKTKNYFLPTKNNFIPKSTQNSSLKSWVSIVQKTQCDISESQIDGFYEITSYSFLREKVGQSSLGNTRVKN